MPAARRTSDTSKLGHFSIPLPTLSADGYLEFPGQHSWGAICHPIYIAKHKHEYPRVKTSRPQYCQVESDPFHAKFCSPICNYLRTKCTLWELFQNNIFYLLNSPPALYKSNAIGECKTSIKCNCLKKNKGKTSTFWC